MKVRGLGKTLFDASKFVELEFYLPITNGLMTHFHREIHILDNLNALILLGMDTVTPEEWQLDFESHKLTLPYRSSITVSVITRSRPKVKNIPVFTQEKTFIPPNNRMIIPVATNSGKIIELNLPGHDRIYEPAAHGSYTTFARIISESLPSVMA